ncbi:hypothetical protein HN51_040947 [Arachis hypogaea]|uniref:Uncharacterized protein n=1 Tax=Arachis hypogaea TaxID=3818 RepID=A0A444YQC6_ARAHY|nr:Glycosyl hydrolase family 10 protein [Arachis hypogaea]RYR04173.1 hypothetical protein Ahy_B06g083764 [Arachis hypogaea]
MLDAASLPIWLTEVSVDSDPNQAEHLEEILREGYSHPFVEGIIMFISLAIASFKDMALMLRKIFIILRPMTLWTSSSISGKLKLRKPQKTALELYIFHWIKEIMM